MVVHIVMFSFKEENKKSNIQKVTQMLRALTGKIETLKSMEVGVNYTSSERAMDLSLISTFDDEIGLEQYAVHPEHLKVVEFIKGVVVESKVVDYVKIVD